MIYLLISLSVLFLIVLLARREDDELIDKNGTSLTRGRGWKK